MPATVKTSLLCPSCRKLISADEPACPYCGLKTPGARWRRGFSSLNILSRHLIQILIGTNVALYILSLIVAPAGIGITANPMSFLSPAGDALFQLGATGTLPIAYYGRWWTLVSASFLHGGLLHLFFNMAALWQLGPFVQQIFGANRFIIIYILSGIAGFLLSYLAGVPFTIGASASLCGLIGTILYYGKSRGGFVGESVYRQATGWIIGLVLFGILIPGINNWAHGGGIVAGLLLGFVLGYEEQNGEPPWLQWVSGVIFIVTALVLLWAIFQAFWPRIPLPL